MDSDSKLSPLVTCAMVTRASRVGLALESARCFAQQSHRNRELLVQIGDELSSAAELLEFENAIRSAAGEQVRFVHDAPASSLGARRNSSFAQARGAFVCQWDDDDLSHPDRISEQLASLQLNAAPRATASFLTDVLHVFSAENTAFLCSWKRAPQGGHPATGLVRAGLAARYPESGPESLRGEDTAFALALQKEGPISTPSRGPLYAYRFTGANTWAREHHQSLIEKMAISRALLLRREEALRPMLRELGLPLGIELRGPNGLAFVL